MKLANFLHIFIWSGQDNNCNTYVIPHILEDQKHVIIDPGYINTPQTKEAALDRLFLGMQQDNIDPEETGLVLLTHFHNDHTDSAGILKEKFNAKVAIHEDEAEFYKKNGGTVDILLKEGDLELGKRQSIKLQIFHSPGHSPGHITIYWPLYKVLFAGDLIFYRSTGRVDLPGGSKEQMKESIVKLSRLEIECILCGHPYGHPGVIQPAQEVQANFDFLKEYFST